MILFYIRHGDPIYVPDSLTPLGERQAEALAKRLSLYGIDEIYASTSNRAIKTATPTAEVLKKEITQLDFANEIHAWGNLTVFNENNERRWLFDSKRHVELFNTDEVQSLGFRWYSHKEFDGYAFEEEMARIKGSANGFLESLGYKQVGNLGKYEIVASNDKRIALFAHAGFGLAFLSVVLGIPYPTFCTHFDMCHSGMTVIEFKEIDGFAYPKIMTYSSDSHLYREGLPTKYNNRLYF
jgi:probable phosphoglycerate mutase